MRILVSLLVWFRETVTHYSRVWEQYPCLIRKIRYHFRKPSFYLINSKCHCDTNNSINYINSKWISDTLLLVSLLTLGFILTTDTPIARLHAKIERTENRKNTNGSCDILYIITYQILYSDTLWKKFKQTTTTPYLHSQKYPTLLQSGWKKETDKSAHLW